MAHPMVKKAEAAVDAARLEVKRLKVLLKQARKSSKIAKKTLKDARRKATAESAADAKAKGVVAWSPPDAPMPPLPKAGRKAASAVPAITVRKSKAPRGKSAPTLRSAADVAKSVIERLQSPPPVLAPPAIIPAAEAVLPESGNGGGADAGKKAT